jgi:SAM-dependent methyltransferase
MAELPFTDERFIPTEKARITHEYYHRYAACLEAGAGKTVLDFACGEGLGSALLASRAAKVIGVDIDLATIRHASEKYCLVTNATFVVRDGHIIPLAENSVDRQRLAIASFVLADEAKGSKLLQGFMVGKHGVESGSPPLRGSLYSLVFCSNNEATSQLIGSLVHLDLEDDLYLEQERVLRWAN